MTMDTMTTTNDDTTTAMTTPVVDPELLPPSNSIEEEEEESSSDNDKKKEEEIKPGDLFCPISSELLFDPVEAEDCHVYERTSIEKHFAKHENDWEIKSPTTKRSMGTRLVPLPELYEQIETFVEAGYIAGYCVDKWKHKVYKRDVSQKANRGDVEAMRNLALCYVTGEHGFPKDRTTAYAWFQKAYVAGSIVAGTMMGIMLIRGMGVGEDKEKGMLYLGLAAGRGCELATYILGWILADGGKHHHGLPMDKLEEARSLLEKLLNGICPTQDWVDEEEFKLKDMAPSKLAELVSSS